VAFVAEQGHPYAIGVGTTHPYITGPIRVEILLTPLPANDDFADRQPLAGFDLSVEADTVGATSETGEPDHGGLSPARSLWYTWTAPDDGQVLIRTDTGETRAQLGVYRGDSMAALEVIPNVNPDTGWSHTAATVLSTTAGATFQIAMDASDPPGPCRLTLMLAPSRGLLAIQADPTGKPAALRLLGVSATSYVVETSLDLEEWTILNTNQAAGSWIAVPDAPSSQEPARFYRTHK
jgi:hypothetical protein